MSDVSDFQCTECGHHLHITNAGNYRCIFCGLWLDGDTIDPAKTDKKRNKIMAEYAAEKALYNG